nr:unnamed protein product [Callosobruchus chinensis]
MRASKRKPSIQPEFQPCRKQLKWDCYQPVPVCLRLEDCGYEPESSINDSYKMIANNPDATVPCSSEWTTKAIKNLKVTCTDSHRTFEAVYNKIAFNYWFLIETGAHVSQEKNVSYIIIALENAIFGFK